MIGGLKGIQASIVIIDEFRTLEESRQMRIYSGKYKNRDLTVSIQSNTPLARWLLKDTYPPHNKRRWTIIKRPKLEELNKRASKLLVAQVNDFDFVVTHSDMVEIFNKLHRLLYLDQKAFRIIP